MNTFVTTGCTGHGHPEVTLTFVEPPIVPHGERLLLGYLENAVAKGTRFEPGQTLGLGGHLLRFKQRADGTLGLEEPVPSPKETWVEAVDRTVREVTFQRWVNESFDLELAFPPLRASVLVSRCSEGAGTVVLTRVDAGDAAQAWSGWSLSCAQDHDHGERFSLPLLALSALRPTLVPFLALPSGSVVVAGAGPAHVFADGKELSAKPGSYLQVLNERASKRRSSPPGA
ncbi:MAG: hypothetical protein ABTQ32_09100 [Myxococcaceae bacterium]